MKNTCLAPQSAFRVESKNGTQQGFKWQRLWQLLSDILMRKPEVQVKQKKDKHGHIYWQVFDPNTGYTQTFGSEKEIRIWLEKSYYQTVRH